MNIVACLHTDRGLVREKNEDNFLFFGRALPDLKAPFAAEQTSGLTRPLLFGVFDGMGGISAGEVASRMAAETARSCFSEVPSIGGGVMERICQSANRAICGEMRRSGRRMGTTAAMLGFDRTGFTLCSLGDSAIFIFRQNRLVKISAEHTERENYIRTHGSAPDGKKFRLTQHLGIFEEEMLLEPQIVPGRYRCGDRYLICSDGLTDMLPPQRLEELFRARGTLRGLAENLMRGALQAGGRDNITLICMEITE